jgi:hypothetical protein
VALPGGRALWVACDAVEGEAPAASPCEAGLLLPDGDGDFSQLALAVDFDTALPRGLDSLRVLALFDGRVLVTGRDPGAVIDGRAFVLDPGRGTLDKRDASRVPTTLVTLRDGAIAELDALGVSLRREGLGSALATPEGNLAAEDRSDLALDAATRWQHAQDGLHALQDDARVELAGLHVRDFRMRLVVEGDVTLRFDQVRAKGRVRAGECEVTTTKPTGLLVERRGAALSVTKSNAASVCDLEVPAAALSVTLRAAKNARVSEWTVERL